MRESIHEARCEAILENSAWRTGVGSIQATPQRVIQSVSGSAWEAIPEVFATGTTRCRTGLLAER